jgi:hypothetical protein
MCTYIRGLYPGDQGSALIIKETINTYIRGIYPCDQGAALIIKETNNTYIQDLYPGNQGAALIIKETIIHTYEVSTHMIRVQPSVSGEKLFSVLHRNLNLLKQNMKKTQVYQRTLQQLIFIIA